MAKNQKLTTAEAAKAAGVPRSTLLHWIKIGVVSAAPVELVDGHAVRYWTTNQIAELRKVRGTLKKGPVPGRKKRAAPATQ